MHRMIRVAGATYQLKGKDVDVSDIVFEEVEGFTKGPRMSYVTVNGRPLADFPDRNVNIRVDDESQITEVDPTTILAKDGGTKVETDDEIMERLRLRFQMLEDMTKATKKGIVRAMVVTGPPGVGKSHGIDMVLSKYDTESEMSGRPPRYEVIKGEISALGLYCKLYGMKEKGNILVFDDCDSVFHDETSLNIMKAALDSKKTRRINWNTDSRKLSEEGIPDTFEFRGSAIFITNVRFDNIRSKKLQDHIEAIKSRCHIMDLTIDTAREKMLRIKQIVGDGMLVPYGFDEETNDAIVQFVDANKDRLQEVSLRTVIKVADLVKAFPDMWEAYAENTVMQRG